MLRFFAHFEETAIHPAYFRVVAHNPFFALEIMVCHLVQLVSDVAGNADEFKTADVFAFFGQVVPDLNDGFNFRLVFK